MSDQVLPLPTGPEPARSASAGADPWRLLFTGGPRLGWVFRDRRELVPAYPEPKPGPQAIQAAADARVTAADARFGRAWRWAGKLGLTGTGAAVGAVAAVPAVGTGTALALSGGEVLSTLELTALFAFSLAQIHGIPLDEIERRRTLVMGIMIGGSGAETIPKIAERTGQHWAKQIVAKVPTSKLLQINKVLGKNFITKYGTRQGIIVLGRVVPFGIGAVIGGGANLMLAETSIRASRRAFGPPPEFWD